MLLQKIILFEKTQWPYSRQQPSFVLVKMTEADFMVDNLKSITLDQQLEIL